MEIQVGEYIRTKSGFILKLNENNIVNVFFLADYVYIDLEKEGIYFEEDLIKTHSKNIIDLIEVDDIGIMTYNGLVFKKFITQDDIIELKFGNYKLKSIVTKEQFNSIKYEVE